MIFSFCPSQEVCTLPTSWTGNCGLLEHSMLQQTGIILCPVIAPRQASEPAANEPAAGGPGKSGCHRGPLARTELGPGVTARAGPVFSANFSRLPSWPGSR